jgi:hypothetical protein
MKTWYLRFALRTEQLGIMKLPMRHICCKEGREGRVRGGSNNPGIQERPGEPMRD